MLRWVPTRSAQNNRTCTSSYNTFLFSRGTEYDFHMHGSADFQPLRVIDSFEPHFKREGGKWRLGMLWESSEALWRLICFLSDKLGTQQITFLHIFALSSGFLGESRECIVDSGTRTQSARLFWWTTFLQHDFKEMVYLGVYKKKLRSIKIVITVKMIRKTFISMISRYVKSRSSDVNKTTIDFTRHFSLGILPIPLFKNV